MNQQTGPSSLYHNVVAERDDLRIKLADAYRALDFWQKYASGAEATYTKAMRDTTMAAREFVERKEKSDD